jgi:hypothetical protein
MPLKIQSTVLLCLLSLLLLTSCGIMVIEKDTVFVKAAPSDFNIIEGHPNATVTIISPQNQEVTSENITVAFLIEGPDKPLEYSTGELFSPFFRYGCFLDSDIIANQTIDYSHWDPEKRGLIVNSNVNISIYPYGNGWLCNATLTKLPQGMHNVTLWVEEEQNYISYGTHFGSVFSTTNFTVNANPVPSATVFTSANPLLPISIAIIAVVIVVISALLIFKKYRKGIR